MISWTVACQGPLSMGVSRQESGLSFPSPGDLPNPGIESRSPALHVDSLLTELQGNKSSYYFYKPGINYSSLVEKDQND